MTSNWSTKKLGEVLKLCDSGTWGVESSNGMPLLRSTNMQNGVLVLDDLKYINVPNDKRDRYTLRDGDILITKSSGGIDHIGKSLFITEEMDGKYGFSNFTQRLRVDRGQVLPKWVYFKISNPATRDFLLSVSQTSTGLRNLKIPALKELEIPIPPLDEQKRIVKKIEKLFAKIDEASRLRAESSTASAALIPSALHRVFANTKDTPESEIAEIAELGRGRVISKKYIQSNPGPYPVYSSQTQNNGEFGRIKSYDFEGEYVTWTTDGANAGQVFYRNGKFNCTNVCGTIKVKDTKKILPKYLAIILSTRTKRYVSIASGNPKLMNNVMAKIKIPIPSLTEQKKIVAYLDSLSAKVSELQKLQTETAADFSALRQSILAQIFA